LRDATGAVQIRLAAPNPLIGQRSVYQRMLSCVASRRADCLR
jgi:hypothetical protein